MPFPEDAASCQYCDIRVAQADKVKAQLFSMALHGKKRGADTPFSDSAAALKPGSVTNSNLQTLLDATDQASGYARPLAPPSAALLPARSLVLLPAHLLVRCRSLPTRWSLTPEVSSWTGDAWETTRTATLT